MRKVKPFSAVKEMKRLSRELLKTRKGRVIQPKKKKVLDQIHIKESQEG